MSESDIVVERAVASTEQWPTLTEAMGCLDCSILFRTAQPSCPHCGSSSMLNVAELLQNGRDMSKMKHPDLVELAGKVTAELMRRTPDADE